MTDPVIIATSYAAERNYSHNPDDNMDSSGAVLAIGNTKESTTELVDLSGNGNIADIHGAMPTEGFIQGRRFAAVNENYIDCGNPSLVLTDKLIVDILINIDTLVDTQEIISANSSSFEMFLNGTKLYAWINSNLSNAYNISGIKGWHLFSLEYDGNNLVTFLDTITGNPKSVAGNINSYTGIKIGRRLSGSYFLNQFLSFISIKNSSRTTSERQTFFNTLARLPFWSINYIDYPDNVGEYTDNLPYSSSIISSGTFKVDDDKLQCVSAGTMTYSASYNFDGSEYIKVEIDGIEYVSTGTIAQGNTTVSVVQGSNKITIAMGTGDTIDGIDIQFREEV